MAITKDGGRIIMQHKSDSNGQQQSNVGSATDDKGIRKRHNKARSNVRSSTPTDKASPNAGRSVAFAPDTKGSPETSSKIIQRGSPSAASSDSKISKKLPKPNWSWSLFSTILVLAFLTRFHKIAEPDHVCWDETHFGKMGSWYINRTFFFDVHPPLGKMMIGFFGYITGYDGTFPFENPGQKYNETRYLGMRVCCTALGSALVPFSYLTVWEMTGSSMASTLAGALVLFDVGFLTLTQYILLDPILLFFISGSVYCSVRFYNYRERSFSIQWWLWLGSTGVFIAGAISVKFVGLFTILYIGLRTAAELWEILGDLSKPLSYTIKHFISRAICLILLPIVLYVSFFYTHLAVLNRSGNGDGFYSSGFQSQLIGNPLYNASMPKDVAYGAIITLKSQRTGGGYLHSHWHLYPEGVGAKQQQITTYAHKDDNNKWIVKKFNESAPDQDNVSTPIEFVKSGDLIRLEHLVTRRNLHSHRQPAPVSKKQFQVTGYGENGTGDANDVWRIEVIAGKDGDPISVVSSRLKLVHLLQNCVLSGTGKQLPKWAYEQMEVSCAVNHRDVKKSTYWNVEENHFPRLPNTSFQVYGPSFLEKFAESHTIMFEGNSNLKPKEGEVTSRPWQWPVNYRGQYFSGNTYRVYLLGNPVIWFANLVLLSIFFALFVYHSWLNRREVVESWEVKEKRDKTVHACTWLIVGWALHYLPFYTMGRVLYFHHYFPALLFSSMLSGVLLDYLLGLVSTFQSPLGKSTSRSLQAVFLGGLAYSFYLFSPLSYGMNGPLAAESNSTMHGLKWFDTWEF